MMKLSCLKMLTGGFPDLFERVSNDLGNVEISDSFMEGALQAYECYKQLAQAPLTPETIPAAVEALGKAGLFKAATADQIKSLLLMGAEDGFGESISRYVLGGEWMKYLMKRNVDRSFVEAESTCYHCGEPFIGKPLRCPHCGGVIERNTNV